nr:M23 family metallopeptidase [Candidatus Paceibacterota bacterium]
SYGWTVPNRTQAKYDSLITVRNSNARLFEQERTRRLTTVGYYVTEYENGAYLKIQMKDEQYGIKAEFPSPDNPMDPRPAVISSGFYALDGIRQGQFHTGIDIPKCEYCSTVAFASGFAKPLSDENRKNIAGKYVELDCPQLSMRFKYAHLSKHKIHWPGKYVEAGDIIGLEGRTGRTTGPNLHFEAILVIDNQEYKLNGKHLFSNFAERIVKDVIYIKKTTGGYKIIPEEEFKEAIESLALER